MAKIRPSSQLGQDGAADGDALLWDDGASRWTPAALSGTYLSGLVVAGTGIDPTGVSDSTTAIQAKLTAAAGKTAYIPAGTYAITAGLSLPKNASLKLDPACTIKATATIAGAMLTTAGISGTGNFSDRWLNQTLVGGTWDCNKMAATGVYVTAHLNVLLRDFMVKNQTGTAIIIGDPANPTYGNEAKLQNVKVDRDLQTDVPPAGEYGIHINAYDSHTRMCIVVGADTSFRVDGDANKFVECHGWGYSGHLPTTIFDNNGFDNEFIGCKADSPSTYGFHMRAIGWRILGGETFNGPLATTGVIGIHVVNPSPGGTIIGHSFNGTVSVPLDQDYDGNWPDAALEAVGNYAYNVNTITIAENNALRNLHLRGPLSLQYDTGGVRIFSAYGDPNGTVTATTAGDLYIRTDSTGPMDRIYRATTTGGTVWAAFDVGLQSSVHSGGTAVAATEAIVLTINDTAIPTFHPGRPYRANLWARDTATGSRYTADADILVYREGGSALIALCAVTNRQGALFGSGLGGGTFGVLPSISADGLTLTMSVKNNHATNTQQFGMKLSL